MTPPPPGGCSMIIDSELGPGCLGCLPYCPMGAIVRDEKTGRATIIEDECVECGVCYRARVCQPNAICPQELEWPRTLRMEFSDPSAPYVSPVFEHRIISRLQADLRQMDRRQLLDREGEELTISGRGTIEMKMNDIMGRFKRGRAGRRGWAGPVWVHVCEMCRRCPGRWLRLASDWSRRTRSPI